MARNPVSLLTVGKRACLLACDTAVIRSLQLGEMKNGKAARTGKAVEGGKYSKDGDARGSALA